MFPVLRRDRRLIGQVVLLGRVPLMGWWHGRGLGQPYLGVPCYARVSSICRGTSRHPSYHWALDQGHSGGLYRA
jgi:hypothetical protein